jgi:hypothetical protein
MLGIDSRVSLFVLMTCLSLAILLFLPPWASAQLLLPDDSYTKRDAPNIAITPNLHIAPTIDDNSPVRWSPPVTDLTRSNPLSKAPISFHVHPFWDPINKVETGAMFGLETFDMAQTCNNFAHGGHEAFTSIQSCPKEVVFTVGIRAAALLAAYALHHTRHHQLERMPMLYMAGTSFNGIVYSKVHGAW